MGFAGQQADDTAVARIIDRPPFLYITSLLLGLFLDRLLPLSLILPEHAMIRSAHHAAGGDLDAGHRASKDYLYLIVGDVVDQVLADSARFMNQPAPVCGVGRHEGIPVTQVSLARRVAKRRCLRRQRQLVRQRQRDSLAGSKRSRQWYTEQCSVQRISGDGLAAGPRQSGQAKHIWLSIGFDDEKQLGQIL